MSADTIEHAGVQTEYKIRKLTPIVTQEGGLLVDIPNGPAILIENSGGDVTVTRGVEEPHTHKYHIHGEGNPATTKTEITIVGRTNPPRRIRPYLDVVEITGAVRKVTASENVDIRGDNTHPSTEIILLKGSGASLVPQPRDILPANQAHVTRPEFTLFATREPQPTGTVTYAEFSALARARLAKNPPGNSPMRRSA